MTGQASAAKRRRLAARRVSGTRGPRRGCPERLLGERVAVPLAVGGAHERGDDVEIPVLDVGCLTPEVGEAEVDVELQEVDPGKVALA